MELENILIGEICTSGLEMYTPMPKFNLPTNISSPSFCDSVGRSPSHPHYMAKPINPILGGGVKIDLSKSTTNTSILKEELGYDFKNVYIHHARGPGRMEFVDPVEKIIEDARKCIREFDVKKYFPKL